MAAESSSVDGERAHAGADPLGAGYTWRLGAGDVVVAFARTAS